MVSSQALAWRGDRDDPIASTRLTWEHTGFHGTEGAFMSRLLGRVRRTMLSQGLPPVLAEIGDDGRLRPGSTLRARP